MNPSSQLDMNKPNSMTKTIQRIRVTLISSVFFALSAFVSAAADDTEIYITKLPESQTPNVLFAVDTSGSMREDVDGTNQSRMDAVKEAMTDLINTTGNLKAGLSRFHPFIGSPIIFPVRDINKTIGNEEPFPDSHTTVASVSQSSDDAEQTSSNLTLDDSVLEMTQIEEVVSGFGTVTPVTECFKPKDPDDDDENGTASNLDINSPDLDIGQTNAGVRFFDVGLPKNAIILHAEVEFTASGSHSEETGALIRGHKVGESQAFVDSPTNDPNAVNPRIANAATNATVAWSDIKSVSAGDTITSPNIRSIVQEIVQHDDWVDNNPVTILFEAQGGQRELLTLDGGTVGSDCGGTVPKLRVTYVEEGEASQFSRQPEGQGDEIWEAEGGFFGNVDDDPDILPLVMAEYEVCFGTFFCFERVEETSTGIRFPNISIPEEANVLWADIEFTSESDNPSNTRSRIDIFGVDETDPAPFNDSNRKPSDLSRTSVVVWEDDTVSGDEELFNPPGANKFRTPNLAPIIFEIMSQPDFESGNHIAFILEDHSDSGVNEHLACSSRAASLGLGSCPEGISAKPTLRIFYELPTTGTVTSEQNVGLRFTNVRVPQGAEITSASLEFVPETTSSQPSTFEIDVENNANPETFSGDNPINFGRAWTGAREWTVDDWQEGQRTASVDVSGLVETVTNRSDWCGGQSMAFLVSGTASLAAKAFDSGSGEAPTLRINYDTSGLQPGEGCTTTSYVASVTDSIDNVFENNNGNVRNDVGELRLDDDRMVGLRFKEVSIPPGAQLESAALRLTANRDRSESTTISVQVQNHPNPSPFVLGTTSNLSDRDLDSDTVDWSPGSWTEGESYIVDLDDLVGSGGILQDIVDGNVDDDQEWKSGNALVLVLQSSLGRRDIEQCCGEGETPSQLTIDYRINLGDVVDPPAKELLLSTIEEMRPDGNTPLTDALYEGGAYFAGAPVHFGRTRGAGASYDGDDQEDTDITSIVLSNYYISRDNRILDYNGLGTGYTNTRLSHPASYGTISGGGEVDIERPSNCSENNPEDYDCRTEHFNNNQDVSYISPFENAEPCERGFLVLLSDGLARDNSSRQLIRDLADISSCDMEIPVLDETTRKPMQPDSSSSYVSRDPTTYEQCGLELADYLYNEDFIDDGTVDTDVRNNVRTFTIGFALDLDRSVDRNAVEYLQALAYVGSGGDLNDIDARPDLEYGEGFYPANNAQELREVFEVILEEIVQETTSFVAPGISVNAFNRLFNLDDIYFSLFRPSTQKGWKGNLKKFKLCTEVDEDPDDGQSPSCEFGEVIDAHSPPKPAVNDEDIDDDSFGTLKTDALGYWSESSDSGPEIDQGGAGERIPTYENRNVYVGITEPTDTDTELVLEKIVRGTHTGDSAPVDDENFNDIKQALFDNNNCNDSSSTLAAQNDCLDELVRWLTGEKFDFDDPRSPGDEDNRWAFGDPMHSRPLVLTYGQTTVDDEVVPLSKIFVGTNDGGFRMINDSGGVSPSNDGVEEWIYYPYSMLDRQSDLKNNVDGSHIYGVDDSPSARVNDVNDNGVIEPTQGDFVHLYIGLRRGGRQIYALDITPAADITSSNMMNQIEPELLWRIDADTTPGFQHLGETWSSPRPVRIALSDGPRTVLIFGGGYSSGEQDGVDTNDVDNYNTSTTDDSVGNGIYIVDAQTGELLWWATSHSTDIDGVVDRTDVPEMNTSIAAPVTPISTDGDPFIDQIYAVDLRGQVFRVDLAVNSSASGQVSVLSNSTVGVLAELGGVDEDKNRRKFFYPPEVAAVIDEQTGGGSYNLIGIVSGNRARPQGKTVLDRAYGLRDYLVDEQVSESNYPACNPNDVADGCTGTDSFDHPEPIHHDDLVDVAEQDNFVVRIEDGGLEGSQDALNALKNSHGWYFDLEGFGLFDDDSPVLSGEKGFAAATVLDGKMFFTTFLPPETDSSGDVLDDACSVRETLGTSRLYAVDFFTGAPAFSDFCVEENCDDETYEKQDRVRSLGAGPSADLVPAYLPGGTIIPVPTGAGAVVQDPRIMTTAEKTYWIENR